MSDEIAFMPATEMRQRFASRELSPVDVADAILSRIDALNPSINAYVTVTDELARKQAKLAEEDYARGSQGLLSGVPISIKDLTWTKGIKTTRGSRRYADWVPDQDAPIMDRVYASGATVLGKTNTPEFGWKGETSNQVAGSTRNPWNLQRTPGGSSGGASAAVAAGLGPLGQGSDGAGSIRIPSGFAGIFGLKPSWALVPQFPASGVIELAHLGPMTRTVGDAALMLDAIAGEDPRDRNSWTAGVSYLDAIQDTDLRGLRVAWTSDLGYAAVDPEVAAIAGAAAKRFSDLGCIVEEAHPGLDDPWEIVNTIWASGMAAVHAGLPESELERIDPGLRAVIDEGNRISGIQLANAYLARSTYYQAWRTFMESYDLVLTPTLPCTAFPVGQDQPGTVNGVPTSYLSWTAFTYPFNVTGQPAATVPCGFASDGLPVGLQIVGRWHDDVSVLRASAAFEAAAPWAHLRPETGGARR